MKKQTVDEQFLEAMEFFESNYQYLINNEKTKAAEIHMNAIKKIYSAYNRINEELGQAYMDYVELREKYFELRNDTQKLVTYSCCKGIDPNMIFKLDKKVIDRMINENIEHTTEKLLQTYVECFNEEQC